MTSLLFKTMLRWTITACLAWLLVATTILNVAAQSVTYGPPGIEDAKAISEYYRGEFASRFRQFVDLGLGRPSEEDQEQVKKDIADFRYRIQVAELAYEHKKPHFLQLLSKALEGDAEQIRLALDVWAEQEPKRVTPHIAAFDLSLKIAELKVDPPDAYVHPRVVDKGIGQAEWNAILKLTKAPDSIFGEFELSEFSQFLRVKKLRADFFEFCSAYLERPKVEFLDAVGSHLAHVVEFVDFAIARDQPELAAQGLRLWRSMIQLNLDRLGQDLDAGRSDMLYLSLFCNYTLNSSADHLPDVEAFLGEAIPKIQRYEAENQWHANILKESFERARLRLLTRIDMQRAREFAFARLKRQQVEFENKTKGYFARTANALSDALILAEKNQVPGVVAVMRETGILDPEIFKELMHLDAEDSADTDYNQWVIARLLRTYSWRYLQSGAKKNMVSWFAQLRSLKNQVVDVRNEGPVPIVSENHSGNYLWHTIQFYECLNELELFKPDITLLELFALERESWSNLEFDPKRDMHQRPVVLILASSGVSDADERIDWYYRLEEISKWSNAVKNQSFFFCLVTDDDGAMNAVDEWVPSFASERIINPRRSAIDARIPVPAVYAYQGKLIDYLIPNAQSIDDHLYFTALIFDREHQLQKIVYSDMEELETLEEAIASTLQIAPPKK